MLSEVVSYLYSSGNRREHFRIQIIFQCAPFFKGLKASAMISLEQDMYIELADIFSNTDINHRILAEGRGRGLVLLYREEELKSSLKRNGVQMFLNAYGYNTRDVEAALLKLSERVCQYVHKERSFPHEIGIFLDYPLEDVRGFIREKGRNGLLNGYWKVYHNPGKAQLTFYAYDKAKVSAVNELLLGKPMREIIRGLS